MAITYDCVEVEQVGDAFVARFRDGCLEEPMVRNLAADLLKLVEAENARKLVIAFDEKECLYSALMAQLLLVRRKLQVFGGKLRLYNVPPLTREVFKVCKLEPLFEFTNDLESALKD